MAYGREKALMPLASNFSGLWKNSKLWRIVLELCASSHEAELRWRWRTHLLESYLSGAVSSDPRHIGVLSMRFWSITRVWMPHLRYMSFLFSTTQIKHKRSNREKWPGYTIWREDMTASVVSKYILLPVALHALKIQPHPYNKFLTVTWLVFTYTLGHVKLKWRAGDATAILAIFVVRPSGRSLWIGVHLLKLWSDLKSN